MNRLADIIRNLASTVGQRSSLSSSSVTLYKTMLVSFVVLAFTVPLGIVALPFVEFFNGMAAQPKARTQMLIGRTYAQQQLVERQPVFGTMPRGYVPYAYDDRGNKIEDAKDVGLRLANPVPINMQNLRRGQKLYNVACINCHGEQGIGDGPVTGPSASPAGGRFPAPPSLHTDEARGYEDGTIFHIITKGVGKMPSHANDLAPADRWKVVHYVRALQRSMNPKPEDLRK